MEGAALHELTGFGAVGMRYEDQGEAAEGLSLLLEAAGPEPGDELVLMKRKGRQPGPRVSSRGSSILQLALCVDTGVPSEMQPRLTRHGHGHTVSFTCSLLRIPHLFMNADSSIFNARNTANSSLSLNWALVTPTHAPGRTGLAVARFFRFSVTKCLRLTCWLLSHCTDMYIITAV